MESILEKGREVRNPFLYDFINSLKRTFFSRTHLSDLKGARWSNR